LRVMFVSGEVPEYSETFMAARKKALERLRKEAFDAGASLVSGVKLTSTNYGLLQEVSVLGTACKHPALPSPSSPEAVITSALSEQELWSLCSQGYLPRSLVLAVSVYNMGLGNDIANFFQNLGGGELTRFTELVTEARRMVHNKLREEGSQLEADRILGLQTEIENFAGADCIEFFAYGTAVQKSTLVTPSTSQLSPQHFCQERTSFTSKVSLKVDTAGSADFN